MEQPHPITLSILELVILHRPNEGEEEDERHKEAEADKQEYDLHSILFRFEQRESFADAGRMSALKGPTDLYQAVSNNRSVAGDEEVLEDGLSSILPRPARWKAQVLPRVPKSTIETELSGIKMAAMSGVRTP